MAYRCRLGYNSGSTGISKGEGSDGGPSQRFVMMLQTTYEGSLEELSKSLERHWDLGILEIWSFRAKTEMVVMLDKMPLLVRVNFIEELEIG